MPRKVTLEPIENATKKQRLAVEYLNQGRTQMSVAVELDVNQTTIWTWARKFGVVSRPQGRRKRVWK